MDTFKCGSFYLNPTCDAIIVIPVAMGTPIPPLIVIVPMRLMVIRDFLVKLLSTLSTRSLAS